MEFIKVDGIEAELVPHLLKEDKCHKQANQLVAVDSVASCMMACHYCHLW